MRKTGRGARVAWTLAAICVVGGAGAGCGGETGPKANGETPPLVVEVENRAVEVPGGARVSKSGHVFGAAIRSEVTLLRQALEGRTFLYGSDLQYSGSTNQAVSESYSTMALGHVSARFRVFGESLQLFADQRDFFESDVNHPERLIHEFPIVRQTPSTITIQVLRASPELVTFAMGPESPPARTSWVRSVAFDPARGTLLIESSIEAPDGWVYEFMESLFPRDALVSKNTAALSADPAREPLSERFHFIDAGTVWVDDPTDGRISTSFVSRFAPSSLPITWYATANLPQRFFDAVKHGVEGWNRYSRALWGRDMIRFAGRLPRGVSIGHPHYNVINWDAVSDAGAAWESQATDPTTGVQSHSLIYMPGSWFEYGRGHWEGAVLSEADALVSPRIADTPFAKGNFLGRSLPLGCLRELHSSLAPSMRLDPEAFGMSVVTATVFHEVGHALGLGHNFKGSASYDGKTATTYTTTTMDYNFMDLDRASFPSAASGQGPLLEYDRQAIAVLYGAPGDLKDTDAEQPMCTDWDVPRKSAQGLIDPFCLQYDAGRDPTAYAAAQLSLLHDATSTSGNTESLAAAIGRASLGLADPTSITTLEQASESLEKLGGTIENLVEHFVDSRLGNMVGHMPWFLYEYRPRAVPRGLDADTVRGRAFDVLSAVLALDTLPPASKAAWNQALASARAWLGKVPAFQQLTPAEQATFDAEALVSLRGIGEWVETRLLPDLRSYAAGRLARAATVPLHFTTTPTRVDYEEKIVLLLEQSFSVQAAGKPRPMSERQRIAESLATFRDVTAGRAAILRLRAAVEAELARASDSAQRQALRKLLAAL